MAGTPEQPKLDPADLTAAFTRAIAAAKEEAGQ